MGCGQDNKASTPFGTLVMAAAALPTFHMLMAGIALAFWAGGRLLAGGFDEPSAPLKQFAYPALWSGAILAPVYLLWIGLTRQLTRREKTRWAIAVVVLNLIAMPTFYVFIARRYLRNRKRPVACPGSMAPDTPVETEAEATQ